jgi:hypothetical protein
MLTARGFALDAQDLEIGNIRDVLSKPFSPRAIVDQIHRTLSSGVPERDAGNYRSEVA